MSENVKSTLDTAEGELKGGEEDTLFAFEVPENSYFADTGEARDLPRAGPVISLARKERHGGACNPARYVRSC